jgi:hypothetical protein
MEEESLIEDILDLFELAGTQSRQALLHSRLIVFTRFNQDLRG